MTGARSNITVRTSAFAKAVERYDALDAAFGGMLDHGLNGGPVYDLYRDRFNALREVTRDRANQINGEPK